MKNKPKKEMEGGYRLQSIRKVKQWLYATQLAIVIIFAIILLLSNKELAANPFHIGVPSFLYFVLIMILVIQVEGMVFLRLETWYLKSPSTKYYMTRNSIRKSMFVIVIAIVFFALFFIPVVNDVVHDASKTTKTYTVSSTEPAVISFYSADVVGLTNFDKLAVMTTGGRAYVFIVSEDNYNQFASQGYEKLGSYRINQAVYEAYPGLEYNVPDLQYGKYYICVYSATGANVDLTVTYDSEISSLLEWYIPWFCVFFIIVNAVWIFYLRPINKLFERAAIYR